MFIALRYRLMLGVAGSAAILSQLYAAAPYGATDLVFAIAATGAGAVCLVTALRPDCHTTVSSEEQEDLY